MRKAFAISPLKNATRIEQDFNEDVKYEWEFQANLYNPNYDELSAETDGDYEFEEENFHGFNLEINAKLFSPWKK
jgi:hypothetical protein